MKRAGNNWAGIGAGIATAICLALTLSAGSVTAINPPPQFLRDVAPILDKKGCSTAGCHGKFGGRAGFQLSLLTLTPQDDFDPIVRGGRGRRINLVEPDKSLFLLKATGKLPHGGGERFDIKSPEYQTIRRWIAAGAPYDPANDVHLEKLSIVPAQFIIPKVGEVQQLKVLAKFSDGTVRNVTDYANYSSTDTAVASVDETGKGQIASLGRRGNCCPVSW